MGALGNKYPFSQKSPAFCRAFFIGKFNLLRDNCPYALCKPALIIRFDNSFRHRLERKLTRKTLTLAFILVLISACNAQVSAPIDSQIAVEETFFSNAINRELGLISAEELLPLLGEEALTLIDVRTGPELAETGIIEDAIHIPLDQLPSMLNALPAKNSPIVVYCRTGNRSNTAQNILIAAGFSNVLDLDGGIANWLAQDFAVQPFP